MAKISDGTYPAASPVIPTALHYLYDPTDPVNPDKTTTESRLANIPSVVKSLPDSATITVGSEVSHVREVTIQLKDADGNNLAKTAQVLLVLYSSAAATALATAPSTGLAIDANGFFIVTLTTKLVIRAKTDATGKITMTYTDTGLAATFLGVTIGDGREFISAALTNT